MRMDLRTEWNHLKPSHPSDIVNWEKKDEQAVTPSRWRCGNSRRRRQVVGNFAQSSSVHGAAYVFSAGRKNTSLCVKIIYRVLFGICLMAVISSIVSLLQDNFSKQSTFINSINRDIETGYEEDPEYFPLYPRITICRRPFHKTDFKNESYLRLVEYVTMSLGSPFGSLTPTELGMIVRLVRYQMHIVQNLTEAEIEFQNRLELLEKSYQVLKSGKGFDLLQFVYDHSADCPEFFVSCIVHIYPVDCCRIFEPVITANGFCFTVRNISPIVELLIGSPSVTSVVLDLFTPDPPAQYTEVGFRVFLTDPSMDIPVLLTQLEGEDVVPQIATTIKAQLTKTKRSALHTPWHGMWDTCPRWRYNASYDSDRYSQVMCDLQFYNRLMREKCQCDTLFNYFSDPEYLKPCEPLDMYRCFFTAAFDKNFSDLASVCKQSCVVYAYKTESSYMGLGGDTNVSRVEIMYNSKQYTYNEYRKATLSSLFSQIGGSLGLYLGASIITIMELVTFTISWLWYRLAPAKVATTTAKVHPPPPALLRQ